ncbi:MAG: hypothetical protein JWO28_32 [Hyphomicrobiales bacterium]|nr:hypothetical protein [Hyphomicrobiales bacterium]
MPAGIPTRRLLKTADIHRRNENFINAYLALMKVAFQL